MTMWGGMFGGGGLLDKYKKIAQTAVGDSSFVVVSVGGFRYVESMR